MAWPSYQKRIVRRAGGHGRADLLAVRHLGQAGALAGHAVDRDQAVEAGAHAAVEAAALAVARVAQLAEVAGRERGRHGLALEAVDGLAVVPEADRASAGSDGGMGQSGAH